MSENFSHHKVLVFDRQNSPWHGFLDEYFEDTGVTVYHADETSDIGRFMERIQHTLLFVNPQILAKASTLKLKAHRLKDPSMLIYQIGSTCRDSEGLNFNAIFGGEPDMAVFQKGFSESLPLPERLKVLVVDDEAEIGEMIKDYLSVRKNPSFEVEYAANGEEGLKKIEAFKPDAVVLDVKMPVKDGREVYREIKERKIQTAVIMFFDAISGYEVSELHEIGRPVILEKGSRQSEMPGILATIKKLVFLNVGHVRW
ncbi:MAG: response regulator [Candidatus Omnitrophica bacterium]|nr:response regulator [Candidatus Omnitrophota bacterium]